MSMYQTRLTPLHSMVWISLKVHVLLYMMKNHDNVAHRYCHVRLLKDFVL
jgi:hypothetical protein